MAKKKKTIDKIYIVGRKQRPKQYRSGNNKIPLVYSWEYIKVFTDYDKASEFVDIEKHTHPEYLYIIEEH